MQWVRNIAFYFIFLSAVMNFLPSGEEKKYIRFFLGILMIIILLKPLLQLKNMEYELERQVSLDSLEESYEEMRRQMQIQKTDENDYLKNACKREIETQLEGFMDEYGYDVKECSITFFQGEVPELQDISLTLKRREDSSPDTQAEAENIKNKLEEVYHIPQGNINIIIQG